MDLASAICLVDLPGYGYAKASKKAVAAWTRLVNTYLKGRPNLIRVFLLIDARHGTKEIDQELMKTLDMAAVNYQPVITKIDKISRSELETRLASLHAEFSTHVAAHPHIIATSANERAGVEDLRAEIASLAQLQ